MPEPTDIIVIDEGQQAQVEQSKQFGLQPLTNHAEFLAAGEQVKVVKVTAKALDKARTDLKKPILEKGRKIDDTFKPLASALGEAERRLKQRIGDWHTAERKRVAEEEAERKRIEEETTKTAESGMPDPLDLVAPAPQAPPPKTASNDLGSVTVTMVKKFRIVDESLVPREYMVVNDKLIRSAVQAGRTAIAGVEIYEEEQVAVR